MTDDELRQEALFLEGMLSQQNEVNQTIEASRLKIIQELQRRKQGSYVYESALGPRIVGYRMNTPANKVVPTVLAKLVDRETWIKITVPARAINDAKLAKALEKGLLNAKELIDNGAIEMKEPFPVRDGPRPLNKKELEEHGYDPNAVEPRRVTSGRS